MKQNERTEVRRVVLWNIPGGIRGILPHGLHSSLTAGLCSFVSQTALPHALPWCALLSLPHTIETATACNERCPAVTHAVWLLVCYSYELLTYRGSSWISWAEQSSGLWWSTDFFFPAVYFYSVLIFLLETEADWNSSCSFCLNEKEQEFINHGTTC